MKVSVFLHGCIQKPEMSGQPFGIFQQAQKDGLHQKFSG
jgi:hypothetical protein